MKTTTMPQFKNKTIYMYYDQIIVHSLFLNNQLYVGVLFEYDEDKKTDEFIYIPIKNEEIINEWLNDDTRTILHILNNMKDGSNIYYVKDIYSHYPIEVAAEEYIVTKNEAEELLKEAL